MVGVTFWSIMTSLCGLARNALMLFLMRVGVGIGEASLSPSAYSIISDYFPREKRGRAASFYSLDIRRRRTGVHVRWTDIGGRGPGRH